MSALIRVWAGAGVVQVVALGDSGLCLTSGFGYPVWQRSREWRDKREQAAAPGSGGNLLVRSDTIYFCAAETVLGTVVKLCYGGLIRASGILNP